jgi:hypothetical protein
LLLAIFHESLFTNAGEDDVGFRWSSDSDEEQKEDDQNAPRPRKKGPPAAGLAILKAESARLRKVRTVMSDDSGSEYVPSNRTSLSSTSQEDLKAANQENKQSLGKVSVPESNDVTAQEISQGTRVKCGYNRGIPRQRAVIKCGRIQHVCPVEECTGTAINIRRHLISCHKNLSKIELKELLLLPIKQKRNEKDCAIKDIASKSQPSATDAKLETKTTRSEAAEDGADDADGKDRGASPCIVKKRRSYCKMECSVCSKIICRLDIHLKNVHKLARNSLAFQTAVAASNVAGSDKILEMKTKKCDSIVELLDDFESHLKAVEGGSKTDRAAQNSRRNVQTVMSDLLKGKQYTPQSLKQLKTIGEPGGIIERWMKGPDNVKTASTMAVYLNSIRLFLIFLQIQPFRLQGFCSAVELGSYMAYITKCSQSLSRIRTTQDQERRIAELNTHIPADVLREFATGFHVKHTSVLLNEHLKRKEKNPTIDSFEFTRNTLIMCILISNAKRAGDLTNMTLDEFNDSHKSEHDAQDNMVHIKEHKTKATHFSKVNFYGELHVTATKYRDVFGEKFIKPSGYFFPYVPKGAPTPRQMTASELNVALNKTWSEFCSRSNNAHVRQEINTSFIRKSIVTNVYKTANNNDDMINLASHMAHSTATAQRHYDTTLGIEKSSAATKAIRKAYKCDGDSNDVEASSNDASDKSESEAESQVDLASPVQRLVRNLFPKSDEHSETQSQSNAGAKGGKVKRGRIRPSLSGKPRPKPLDPNTINLIIMATAPYRELCKSGVKTKKSRDIRLILEELGGDYADIYKHHTDKQVSDRVGYQIEKELKIAEKMKKSA